MPTSRNHVFEVYVSFDEAEFKDKHVINAHCDDIIDTFTAALDHWIAEQRLELK